MPDALDAALLQQQQHFTQLYQVSEGLETPIQLIYLLTLLGFLGAGAFLVVRQVLIRRELDEAAKQLGERIRTGEATCEVGLTMLHEHHDPGPCLPFMTLVHAPFMSHDVPVLRCLPVMTLVHAPRHDPGPCIPVTRPWPMPPSNLHLV